jgi:hypothetical protein
MTFIRPLSLFLVLGQTKKNFVASFFIFGPMLFGRRYSVLVKNIFRFTSEKRFGFEEKIGLIIWAKSWSQQGDYKSDHKSDYKCDHKSDYKSDHKSDYKCDHKSDYKSDHKSDYKWPSRIFFVFIVMFFLLGQAKKIFVARFFFGPRKKYQKKKVSRTMLACLWLRKKKKLNRFWMSKSWQE